MVRANNQTVTLQANNSAISKWFFELFEKIFNNIQSYWIVLFVQVPKYTKSYRLFSVNSITIFLASYA